MNTEIIDAGGDISGGYKVDVSRGENVDRVSSEWFSRPDDERYLSLDDLFASVKGRAERSRTRTVESAAIRVEAHRDNPEKLGLVLPGADEPIAPTHWSFGQLSSLVGAPAAYLRQLPAPLAGINLQYGLTNHRAEQIKTMEVADGRTELRAVTGPDYGRIYDHELVSAVQRIAGNGTGDTRWKVPGVLDWSTGIYNPRVDVTKETTTLYASDRDVFLFLVDDLNPIEAGLLPDGSPDLYFRGFYCWNSEVGAKTLGIASFYLRAVCQNRNLWGVEDFQEITIRHSKYAASHFAHEAAPALTRFAESSPAPFIDGSGTGKTHIALGLGLAACQKGMSVSFTTAAALVNELMEARDERRLLRVQKQMAAVKLLIIDELGFVPLSKTGAELLFEMISQRYERGATLITSNLPFDEWTETFGTERLTGALLDRLTHHVNILEMNGESYRLAQSRARKPGENIN